MLLSANVEECEVFRGTGVERAGRVKLQCCKRDIIESEGRKRTGILTDAGKCEGRFERELWEAGTR